MMYTLGYLGQIFLAIFSQTRFFTDILGEKTAIQRLLYGLLFGYFTLFGCINVEAADKTSAVSVEQQRQLYKEALQALRRGNAIQFDNLQHQLASYPLHSYLQYAQLATHLSLSKRPQIDQFLTEYHDQPVAARLRHRWLEYLRNRDRWKDFLDYYQPENSTTEQQCFFQLARYRNGQTRTAIEGALDLWVVGKSQPKACDKLFAILIDDKIITEEVAWQRFTKAVLNHQYQLAQYLKKFFVTDYYQTLSDRFYRVDRNPEILGNYQLFAEHPPEVLEVIEHGLIHLARINAKKTLGYWGLYHQTHPFDANSEQTIIEALVKSLYEQGLISASDTLLTESITKMGSSLLEWRLRKALETNNWEQVDKWISLLPEEYQQDIRWQYWSIRARLALNKISDEQARLEYSTLAGKRNFYGFLASDRINQAYAMEHRPINVSQQQLDALDDSPAFRRIRELLYHGEELNARREWVSAANKLSESELLVASQWATNIDWPDRAIAGMIQASYWDDIVIRFPTPYKHSFIKQARQSGVPIPLLYALARQESAMRADATSPAGAKGLIQLMPATARETAKRHNVRYSTSSQLHDPEINILLGSRYYSDMLARFNNRILATAAYNAGPHRVDSWIAKSKGKRPFDVWIETIPFLETRNYVQNVLAFSAIYGYLLEDETAMLSKKERATTL